jgi:ABC-2 type transport system permease protein
MIAALQAELIKLRRPRLLVTVFAVMAALAGLATALVFLNAGSTASTFGAGRPGAVVLGLQQLGQTNGATRGFVIGAGFAGVVALVLFAVSMAGEYSHATLRNLLLVEPRRGRVLAGKLVALFLLLAAGFLVAEVAAVATAYAFAAVRGVSTHAWLTGPGLRSLASSYGNAVLAGMGWGLLGAAAGVILRSVGLALAVALAWVMPLENILHNSWSAADKWFPGLLLQGLGAGTGGAVSWARAGITLLALLGALAGVAWFTLVRRDVTA